MHEVTIFLTVRYLPMPYIKNVERLLVRAVQGVPNFYQAVSRYGYQEVVDHGPSFVSQVISTIMHKLELKSGIKYRGLQDDFIHELEGDDYKEEEATKSEDPSAEVFGLSPVHEDPLDQEETSEIEQARNSIVEEVSNLSNPNLSVSKFARDALRRIQIVASAPDALQSALEAYDAALTLVETAGEKVVYYLGRASTRASSTAGVLHGITVSVVI